MNSYFIFKKVRNIDAQKMESLLKKQPKVSIEKEEADFGIVPLENSLEGPVVETLDGLVEKNVNIISQIDLKISHFLMSQEKSTMNIDKI